MRQIRQAAGAVRQTWWSTLCAVCVLCATTMIAAHAQTYTTLHSFDLTDGASPQAGLIQGTDGNLYGTAYTGGAFQYFGTVFRITPTGTLTTLHSFDFTDGESPSAALVQAADGNFYGTTSNGGANQDCAGSACGTVFDITSTGTLTTLHNFDFTDGESPSAALVQATDGNFYGTTSTSITGGGTVFKITLGGTLTTLYSFCSQSGCTDGAGPNGLIESNGNFYGTTYAGGANGKGTVFKITPSGRLTTLYSFCAKSGCADGELPPAALVQAVNGNFYGTTYAGGANASGTVFEITPSGRLTTVYSFCSESGCSDGSHPFAGLVQATDGKLYGTTAGGGANLSGTVFNITPGGTLTTLYSFCPQSGCTDGDTPRAGLLQDTDGAFYGTTTAGGANRDGTVFSLSVGLGPFVETQPTSGKVGAVVIILGTNLAGTTGVRFNGVAATFTVVSSSEITTAVPAGASDGNVEVTTPGGTLSSNVAFQVIPPLSLGLHFDYDGSNGTDYTVWRPSNGTWYVLPTSGGTPITTQCGESGDIVVPGDYDGDGITDYAIWRPLNGTWYVIYSSTGQLISYAWGVSTDIPVPGDYDGDGKTDYAVWRPSNGTWYVVYSSTGKSASYAWGESTDLPVLGDFDGDGKTDYAIWRPSTGTWWVVYSSTGKSTSHAWGESTDIPVTGDYDGDGKTDYAIWRPSTGTWWVVYSSTGETTSQAWGVRTDIPVARDYDGDNKTDYAVWRPSTGTWYVIDSSTGKTKSTPWGVSTDVPVNKPTGE